MSVIHIFIMIFVVQYLNNVMIKVLFNISCIDARS